MSAVPKKSTKTAAKKDPKTASRKGKAADSRKGNKAAAKSTKPAAKATNKSANTKANPKGNKGAAKGNAASSGKGGAKGGKKTTNKQNKKNTNKNNNNAAAAESKEEEKTSQAQLEVDIGPPVELPETKEFISDIIPIKEFELKEDDVIESLREQFESFQQLLKARKKACLVRARGLVAKENEDTPPICIDIEGMKKLINNIGLSQGEKEYNVSSQRTKCIDKAKELIAYETKLASIQKKLAATNKETVQEEIGECKKVLEEAEPILREATESLKTISKSSLDEIRALPKPNKLLVKTVKACAIMVGKPESELDGWPNVKKLLKTTFINTLVKFEARNITPEIRANLETNYLAIDNDDIPQTEKLTYDNVQKANAVAGNMVKWIEAQLRYNEFIPKVEPMQARLKELEVKLLSVEGIAQKYEDAITELNKRIETAKGELREEGKAFNQCNAALKQQSLVNA